MKNKARELKGSALDWAVADAVGRVWLNNDGNYGAAMGWLYTLTAHGDPLWSKLSGFRPHADWSQAGPLIEQNDVTLSPNIGDQYDAHERWHAVVPTSATSGRSAMGPTPLIAAMRALVFAKLGAEIEIPSLP